VTCTQQKQGNSNGHRAPNGFFHDGSKEEQ
jgi:hypothetical protein